MKLNGNAGESLSKNTIFNQRQVFAITRQLEVGMQGPRRIDPVLAGAEDPQESPRGNLHVGKLPSRRIAWVVCEVPADELNGAIIRVVEFDPVRELTILVRQRGIIARLKFADYDTGGGLERDGPDRRESRDDSDHDYPDYA